MPSYLRNPELVPVTLVNTRWSRPARTDPLCLESPLKYQKGPTMVINTPRRPEANAAPQSFLIGYLLAFLLNNLAFVYK